MPNRGMTFTVASLILAGATLTGQVVAAQKTATASANWPCVIAFDRVLSYTDAAGSPQTIPTAVQGDGKGP